MSEILPAILFLLIGFVLLIKGADFFVEGSSSVAKLLRVPSLIIGLTIVAMGTSLPECAVSITASMTGNNALAVSNVVGSNIFNLLVVCGACALFSPMLIQKESLSKEFPFSIGCSVLLLVLGYLGLSLSRGDGLFLVTLFICYLVYMIFSALKARRAASDTEDNIKVLPVWKCIIYIVGGIAAIKFGGDFVVNGASTVAASFGLSQNLIGLTIVAVGTSLPELVTSVVAARKKELAMAVGNILGSNIFNILLILGLSASLSPIAFVTENIIDVVLMTAVSLLAWGMGWTKQQIDRREGIVMLSIYAVYLIYICIR